MKLPLKIPFHYSHNNNVFVQIVYFKDLNGWCVYVYTIYKEGKGICFGTTEYYQFRKLFKNLESESIYLRLKILRKLLFRLENKILKRGIPYKGILKSKRIPIQGGNNNKSFKVLRIKKESHGYS